MQHEIEVGFLTWALHCKGPLPVGGLKALLCFEEQEVGVGGMRSTCDIFSGLEKDTGVIQGGEKISSEPTLRLRLSVLLKTHHYKW